MCVDFGQVLYDCGVVHTKEPFQRLVNQVRDQMQIRTRSLQFVPQSRARVLDFAALYDLRYASTALGNQGGMYGATDRSTDSGACDTTRASSWARSSTRCTRTPTTTLSAPRYVVVNFPRTSPCDHSGAKSTCVELDTPRARERGHAASGLTASRCLVGGFAAKRLPLFPICTAGFALSRERSGGVRVVWSRGTETDAVGASRSTVGSSLALVFLGFLATSACRQADCGVGADSQHSQQFVKEGDAGTTVDKRSKVPFAARSRSRCSSRLACFLCRVCFCLVVCLCVPVLVCARV